MKIMKIKIIKKINKQTAKHEINNFIKNQVHDYEYEQQILNSLTYCPCECCDGFWFYGLGF